MAHGRPPVALQAGRPPGRPLLDWREEQQRFWRLIAEGVSSKDAAVACGVSQPLGPRWFREGGGMPPIGLDPPSGRYLSFAEREEIAVLRAQGREVRDIARQLGRAPSTISRELRRNAATRGGRLDYRASVAQWHADRAARRPKASKLAATTGYASMSRTGSPAWSRPRTAPRSQGRRAAGSLDRSAARTPQGPPLGRSWSPEQIAHRLKVDFSGDETMGISREAINEALYIQSSPRR